MILFLHFNQSEILFTILVIHCPKIFGIEFELCNFYGLSQYQTCSMYMLLNETLLPTTNNQMSGELQRQRGFFLSFFSFYFLFELKLLNNQREVKKHFTIRKKIVINQ